MEVVIIGNKGFDTLEYNLADSFKFSGHKVTILDLSDIFPVSYSINYHAIKYIRKYDEYIFTNLAKKVIELNPDLVVGTYRFINPLCIKMIKSILVETPIIHINPDALTTFELQQIFASPYDFYFTKDPYIETFMKNKMGLNAFYLPEAFNPRIHKKPTQSKLDLEIKTNIDVLAFGYLYPYRVNLIKKLIDANINISLYGLKDKRFFDPTLNQFYNDEWITGERKSELLYGAKIVFNNFHYAEIDSVNCKFFEISGIGAFQICDYKPTINEYSKIDVEKFTFKEIDEAIEKIRYYIDRPNERHLIAEVQYNHFLENHTYDHRITKILQTVFK
jgi:spore maturation protein CgeB